MNINKKILKLIFIASLIILIALVFIYLYLNNDNNKTVNYVNTLRLDSNFMYKKVISMWPLDDNDIEMIRNESMLDDSLSLTIVDLKESILFSNSKTINKSNNRMLLDAFYMDSSYINQNANMFKISQPIYHNDIVVAFIIFEKEYLPQNVSNKFGLKITTLLFFMIIFVQIVIAFILLYGKNKKGLAALNEGLSDMSKGVLRPLAVKKNNEFAEIYNTYNMLVEELIHIMKQKQSYEGKRKAFLTMISHELKTPIATINAYIEGIVSGVAKDDETKQRYLAIISDKMRQLTVQVEDFFKYAQEDANRFKYNFEECYADELISTIFSSLIILERPQTKIENLLPKCIFMADKTRLEQVILNLYNNALKHTSKDDAIILKAYREDDYVVIEIEDTGEGINPKDLPYIFDYYFQGQSSKTTDYEGVGLGLAICKAIIDKHNGSMKVKSKLGYGTTMYIKIPLS